MRFTIYVSYIILLVILANMYGMFFPALKSTFTPYYGSIAKNIVLSGNWANLMLLNQDWLDKPHIPFWLTALSYKAFGINTFAYILPGFLFHLIGLYFTYKLARLWYSKETAILAVLFSASSIHLLLSSIDVRAEAFLLGEITPACYLWLRYDKTGHIKYLLSGAFFTALAIMTKGIFVLLTIFSGIIALWVYRRKWTNFIKIRWLAALLVTLFFIIPELAALYYQFDLHPYKLVYGHTQVSGLKWFFWDSQFGRFLSTGPLRNDHADFSHYFFFIHTFLWAYLPWSPLFVVAVYTFITNYICDGVMKDSDIFLFSSFFITFMLFSISKFQVDHYTNILFPFASIIVASWIVRLFNSSNLKCLHKIFYIENIITLLLLLLVLGLAPLFLSGITLLFVVILAVLVILLTFVGWSSDLDLRFKITIPPTLAIIISFIFIMTVNGTSYIKYDGGYQIAQNLNQIPNIRIASYAIPSQYQMDMLGLNFHSINSYTPIDSLRSIAKIAKPLYLVIPYILAKQLMQQLPTATYYGSFKTCSIETFIAALGNKQKLQSRLYVYAILKVY